MAVTISFKYTSTTSGYESGTRTETGSSVITNLTDFLDNTIGRSNLLTAELTFTGTPEFAWTTKEFFKNCTNVTSIKINDNITSTGTYNGFSGGDLYGLCYGCTNLLTFTWGGSNTNPYQLSGDISYAFYNCQKMTTCTLPDFLCEPQSHSLKTMAYMFYNCYELTTLNCNSWKTYCYDSTSLNYMFYNCQKLTTIPRITLTCSFYQSSQLPYWKLGLYATFYNCYLLTDIPLHIDGEPDYTWTMYMAFYYCRSLTEIDLTNFGYTTNSDALSYTFSGCSELTKITFYNSGSYKTIRSNQKNLRSCFSGCNKLTLANMINFSSQVFSGVTTWNYCFSNCNQLNVKDLIPIINITTSTPTMPGMFGGCQFGDTVGEITTFDISDFSSFPWVAYITQNASYNPGSFGAYDPTLGQQTFVLKDTDCILENNNMGVYSSLFAGNKYKRIVLDVDNQTPITTLRYFFYGCTNLQTYDLGGLDADTSSVTDMGYMFCNCSSLEGLDVSNFNTENVTNMYRMFDGCSSLEELDVSNFNTTNVTNMGNMFYNCSGLEELDVSNFNTANVTNMSYMFYGCSGLEELDVSNFNTEKVTNFCAMFCRCFNITELDLTSFDTSIATNMADMFNGAVALENIYGIEDFDTSSVTRIDYMFANQYDSTLTSLPNLNLSKWDVSKVTNMRQAFNNYGGEKLNLAGWDTSGVTNTYQMFKGASNLEIIYVNEDFDTTSLTNSGEMFQNCTSLMGDKGTTYNSSHVDAAYAKIDRNGTSGYLSLYIKPVKIANNDVGEFYWNGSLVRSLYFNGTQLF